MNIEKVTNTACPFDLSIEEYSCGILLSLLFLSFSMGNVCFFPTQKKKGKFENINLVVNKVSHSYGPFCCCYVVLFEVISCDIMLY